ncbi:MAG: T9SS type A sorting domain-containing protein, partial [Bacteroidales bacterium]|nr:T9SS type A sorting domain-containing protein [Bacteroidales bacterium]
NVNGKVKITITDIRGRIIETMDLIANNRIEATIDLNNNSKGIYFINIITDNAKIAERLIIK